ncbi:hypothetical protein TorRG33x02_064070 [Trema orientale]|uniref:F-box associated domain n=1 Tax=Trema orientale TaxID=63057 RepID=A0A2P5FJ68_TREOI|nr:hypothetical protein TorRG33x02_064070 [Trema orientale]
MVALYSITIPTTANILPLDSDTIPGTKITRRCIFCVTNDCHRVLLTSSPSKEGNGRPLTSTPLSCPIKSQKSVGCRRPYWRAGLGFIGLWIVWDVDRERFRTILSFDVRDEVLGQIPLPPDDRDCAHDHEHRRVVELASFVDDRDRKGLLTWFEYNSEREEDCNNGSRFRCYVWVMKEYGSVDSWTKSELNISLSKPFSVVGFLSESMLLIRVTDGSMILYDTKTQRKECLRIDADTKILSYVGTYMESFFRLKNN